MRDQDVVVIVILVLTRFYNFSAIYCVAYTTCAATLWHDRIYLFICPPESSAYHVV